MFVLLKKIIKKIGPGFVTGAADDDPSGIATYSQTGAIFGFSQLWLALFSFPFMVVIQQNYHSGYSACERDNEYSVCIAGS